MGGLRRGADGDVPDFGDFAVLEEEVAVGIGVGFGEIGPLFVVESERLARLECVRGWSEDSQGLVAGVALFEDDLHLAAGFGGDEWLLGCEVGGVEVGVFFGGGRAGGEKERDGETEEGWW